ncbi:MAG: cyclic nucleotide-binding domain-containing protein [Verrucomicrobiota bacterium]
MLAKKEIYGLFVDMVTFSEISRMTLFRGFDANFVRMLDLFFLENDYSPEDEIVTLGEVQDRFFIIIAGEVEVYHTLNNKFISLAILSAGQFFGEMNLFDPGVATASVKALTPVKTLEITNAKFRSFISNRPELAADFTFQLTTTIVKRFRDNKETLVYELNQAKQHEPIEPAAANAKLQDAGESSMEDDLGITPPEEFPEN